jgi:hypothetical protein
MIEKENGIPQDPTTFSSYFPLPNRIPMSGNYSVCQL